jgi:hypothetical protein
MTAAPPPATDLADGLRRLKLRRDPPPVPEVMATARARRWELLRVLIEAEITVPDASNAATRMKNAALPVVKTLDELDGPRHLSPARPWTAWPPSNGSRGALFVSIHHMHAG